MTTNDTDATDKELPALAPSRQSTRNDEENVSYLSSTDVETEDNDDDYDGHRPSRLEIQLSQTQSRTRSASRRRGVQSDLQLSSTITRRQTVMSRLRSRATPVFTHPEAGSETTKAVLVDFDGPDDPYKPINWPMRKKVLTTLCYGVVTMSASYASASFAAPTAQVAEYFHVGNEVATLGTTLFLCGFGVGPLLWAPISEVYGRKVAVIPPMFIAICFSFASATAKDIQTLMISRFFGGYFASAPVTNTGGVLGDLFSPAQRGTAIAGYSMAVVAGPCLAPIISAAVTAQPFLGWRWAEYLTGILQALVTLIALIFVDESYPPRLLLYKARRLRLETGNWALHAAFEEWDISIYGLVHKFLVRPFQLLATPICFFVAIYASFCYGILYMNLGAIGIIFGEARGWPAVSAQLPFLALLLGTVTAAAINIINQHFYNKAYEAAGRRVVPERRLPPMMLGGPLFAAGLFLTGWTGEALSIHWFAPVFGVFLTGMGFLMIFQAALNYLVDTFTQYAASAVSANTFLRSVFAAAFPLFVTQMYHALGSGKASCITGGFATLLIPVPYVLFRFGKRIRASSEWSKASVY